MTIQEIQFHPKISKITLSESAAVNNFDLLILDTTGIKSAIMQISGTFVGTVSYQGSNYSDFTGAVSIKAMNLSTSVWGTSTTAPVAVAIPVNFKYIRARVTAYTSGTINAVTVISNESTPLPDPAMTAVGLATGSSLVGDFSQQYRAGVTGGASIRHIVSAASTNATIAKASGGKLIGWSLANTTASWKYVKLHNIASTPTVGTGVVMTLAVPPNSVNNRTFDGGINFGSGIGYTIVNLPADNDATAVAANDVIGDLFYV